MDLRPVFYITGIFLCTLAASMVFPLIIDLYTGNSDWRVFALCMLITAFFGGTLIFSNHTDKRFNMTVRQAVMLTTLSWTLMALFAALPLWFSELGLSFTDAVFEAMSGITTTGSTVITGLDNSPPGLLLWRGILQWLGGIGIIVMALSVLPFLKVGGMQLFKMESSESEKALPRTAQMAKSIGIIYVGLTFLNFTAYNLAGFEPFDALCHALTTISTGGFSTYDSSFSGHDTVWIELVAIMFMIAGGLPFILYLKALRGNWMAFFRDSQVRWFLSIISVVTTVLGMYLISTMDMAADRAFIKANFNTVSLMTGTGFASDNYSLWGGFATSVFLFLMCVGACAGSTSCGIKIFRFQILYAVTRTQFKKLLHPHGVFMPRYNNNLIPEGVPSSVMSFFFLYAFCFAVLTVSLSLTGLDFLTAVSGAATSISNVGPGLGDIIGPAGTFTTLPDTSKWLLCAGMLMGRLELFTVLVMFSPQFWRH